MDYMREINAFYVWLETNELSHPARHLWHALMHVANRAGWQVSFTVAMTVLESKTGMNAQMIKRARNELVQMGRIKVQSRKGNQCAVYTLANFAVQNRADFVPQVDPQPDPQPDPQFDPQPEPITRLYIDVDKDIYRQPQQPRAREACPDLDDPAFAEVAKVFAQELRPPTPSDGQHIAEWLDAFEVGIITEAIRDASANGARSAKYVDAILQRKKAEGITTLDGYQAAQRAFAARKLDKQGGKGGTSGVVRPCKEMAHHRYTQREYTEKDFEGLYFDVRTYNRENGGEKHDSSD